MPLTYGSYLRLDELLELQTPLSEGPEHDEMLFIVIHQVYELWFKQILHEVDRLRALLEENDTPRAHHTLKRILTILKVMVAQIDVLETMTPLEFLSFRDRLESSSGFESFQFRAVEFAMGMKRRSAMDHYPEGSEERALLERRFPLPTVWDSFAAHLARKGHPVPASVLERDVTQPLEPSPEMQEFLIDLYRSDPETVALCERLIDFDEGVQEWRYRHVKMVQRTIGAKIGTGGSPGAQYLMRTLMTPAFPDLWEIRSRL
jgi:tryptophan 2,3-dioxygenase